jgi:hypothetical protein
MRHHPEHIKIMPSNIWHRTPEIGPARLGEGHMKSQIRVAAAVKQGCRAILESVALTANFYEVSTKIQHYAIGTVDENSC